MAATDDVASVLRTVERALTDAGIEVLGAVAGTFVCLDDLDGRTLRFDVTVGEVLTDDDVAGALREIAPDT
jgi:hypothetical protein